MKEKVFKRLKFPVFLMILGLTAEISYLSADQKTYEEKCSRCHSLKDPGSYSKADWKRNVERMAKRAGLSQTEIDSIIRLNTKQ